MKKGVLSGLGLLLTGFVSAYSSNYFSISDVFDALDPSTVILGSIFILLFTLILFSLSNFKKFKLNKGTATIISFCASFLSVYLLYKSGFDYNNFYYGLFDNIGLSSDIASNIIPVILLIGLGVLIWRFGFAISLIVFGLLLMGSGIFGIVYEQFGVIVAGFILTLIGLFVKKNQKKKE